MFHRITPKLRGTTGLWRGATGTVQICPPQWPPQVALYGTTDSSEAPVPPVLQIISKGVATSLVVQGPAQTNRFAVCVYGPNQTGAVSNGVFIRAGRVNGDWGLLVNDAADAFNYLGVAGDGHIIAGWNSTTSKQTLTLSTGGIATLQSADNSNGLIVNDSSSSITQGIVGFTIQHGGAGKGFVGTGPATMTGAAVGDFGIVAAGGELSCGLNGTGVGVLPTTWWIRQSANHTLTSQTAAQAAFNTTAAGTITLPAGIFEFECFMPLSGMSATSGSFGFAVGGTASPVSVWWSIASKLGTAAATPEAVQWTYNLQSNANTALATASTATTGFMLCRGFFACSAGTIIPQISLGVAAAATVAAGAYFFCRLLSQSGSRTSFGPWT